MRINSTHNREIALCLLLLVGLTDIALTDRVY